MKNINPCVSIVLKKEKIINKGGDIMEKTFQEVMNTIKEGETWINKYDDRRLAKIEKSSNVIHFKFNGEFEKIGVMLDDIFILDKKNILLRRL